MRDFSTIICDYAVLLPLKAKTGQKDMAYV